MIITKLSQLSVWGKQTKMPLHDTSLAMYHYGMIYVRQNRDHIVLGVGWVMLGVWVEIWSSTQQWNTSLPQVSFQQVANTANCIIKAIYLPTYLPSLSLVACIEIISNLHFVERWAKIRLAIFTLPERVWPNAPRLSPESPWRLLLRALHDRHSPSPPCCSCLHHSPAFPHLSLKKKTGLSERC